VPAGITVDKKDTGYKLFVGAGLHPNFAVEFGYVDHGKLNVSGGGQSAGIKAQGYFLDAVGRLPLDNNFGVFAKVGVFNGKVKTYGAGALGFADESDSGTDMKYGLGVSYSMTKNIAVRGEWERYRYKAFDEKSDVDLLSIGLSYSF
jgi:OOP family OmpA-OmpF porin